MIVAVLPAYNEAEGIGVLLGRFAALAAASATPVRVIVVDDGSRDDTAARAEAVTGVEVRVVRHPRNLGLGAAIRTGLTAAVETTDDVDLIVTMDADDSHQPDEIPAMVARIDAGADVVIASRYRRGSRIAGLSKVREGLSLGASWLFRAVCPIPGVRDYTCGFRVYRRRVLVDAFRMWGDRFVDQPGFSCMVDILLKISLMPVTFAETPMVLRYDRKRGVSKMNVRRTITETLRLLARRRLGRYRP